MKIFLDKFFYVLRLIIRLNIKIVVKDKWRLLSNFEMNLAPDVVLNCVRDNSMIPDARLVNLRESFLHVKRYGIKGDYVECGVWKGGSVAYSCFLIKNMALDISVHMFDAFDDICEPDWRVDGVQAVKDVGGIQNASGNLTPVKGVYNDKGGHGSEDRVINLLISEPISFPRDKIKSYKGWFQDVLPIVAPDFGMISVLRLDGDWYSSTKVCLDHLYDRVSSNGVIIIDDYGCYEGCKKAVDEFLVSRNLKPLLVKVDDYCIYFIKE